MVAQLEIVFAAEFYKYTRDDNWMQDAVGLNSNWIYVHGMSAWHVRTAIQTVHKKCMAERQKTGEGTLHD